MGCLTAKQFSEKWGISERRIIKLCKENRINGAIKNGMVWTIPEDTIKPSDKRSKISQYINTQKRIIVININTQIGYELVPLLKKEGYIIDGFCKEKTEIDVEKLENVTIYKANYKKQIELEKVLNETSKYYDGLVFVDTENEISIENKEWLINEFAQKMNCESSIILVNYLKDVKTKLESKLASNLKENIGLRINAVNIDIPTKNKILMNYKEIAEDVFELLINFKNSTGMSITTDGGAIEFDKNGRTKPFQVGMFYKIINNYFKSLNKNSYLWSASTMLEDEWTEEPAEMNFRVINIDAANRGARIDRIFIFSKAKIKEFKNNKTLKIYMQSNINTMFVDLDEIKEKEPHLLEILGEGWDGIDLDTLIVDLTGEKNTRGYVSINKKEVQEAYNCFLILKEYAKDLKEVLKK